MVAVLNLEVCKMYSFCSARKVNLFKDFMLAVFLSVVCHLLAAVPVAYAVDNYALAFDGTDDYVETPISDVPADGTVEAWVKTTSNARQARLPRVSNAGEGTYAGWYGGQARLPRVSNAGEGTSEGWYDGQARLPRVSNAGEGTSEGWYDGQAVISSHGGTQEFRLHLNYQPGKAGNSPGVLGLNVRFRTLTAYTDIGAEMYDGSWHHVAFVWEGASPGNIRAFWDGQEKPVTYRDHNPWEGNYNRTVVHVIGRECLTNNLYYFTGTIDEVRFWYNKTRTQSEIQEYMNRELMGDEEGLKGYWKFNEAEGTTAYDSSPNKNHGTIAGASWTMDAAPVKSTLTEAFTFVQVCDPQLGWGAGYQNDVNSFKQAVRCINSLNPDLVVICGDLVDNFNDSSIADFLQIRSGLTMPSYCAPGNHDVGNSPTLSRLERYRQAIGNDYFSFEHKGYTFVITNTSLWKAPLAGESEKQDTWLKQTLEAARDKNSPVFVVQHYPLYLKSPDEAEEYYNLPSAKRSELLALFENCGVVAVLGGHRHELIINDYKGIQLVNGEATSRNTDGRPLGFRLWHVDSPTSIRHEFVPLIPPIDFNGDQKMDWEDLSTLAQHWLQDEPYVDITPKPYGDNIVNFKDLAVLAQYWLKDFRLLAHWRLDETEGSVAKDRAGTNHGTLHGDPLWQPAGGQVDGALQFDGIDDYVSTPFILDPANAPFSVFAWIKGGRPGQVFISQTQNGVNWLWADPVEGKLMTNLKTAGRSSAPLSSQAAITNAEWHCVGFVWDGSNRILYADDVEVAKDSLAALAGAYGGLHLGAGNTLDAASFFAGLIDDVRIYDRAIIP